MPRPRDERVQGTRAVVQCASEASVVVDEPLYDAVCASLTGLGAQVERGVFGAHMEVSSVNQGPFTVLLDH